MPALEYVSSDHDSNLPKSPIGHELQSQHTSCLPSFHSVDLSVPEQPRNVERKSTRHMSGESMDIRQLLCKKELVSIPQTSDFLEEKKRIETILDEFYEQYPQKSKKRKYSDALNVVENWVASKKPTFKTKNPKVEVSN